MLASFPWLVDPAAPAPIGFVTQARASRKRWAAILLWRQAAADGDGAM
jgi:hypothetical protein